jgi:hypothetical protein
MLARRDLPLLWASHFREVKRINPKNCIPTDPDSLSNGSCPVGSLIWHFALTTKGVTGGAMFKILIWNNETETFKELATVRYKTREKAEEAVKHMFVQVRPGGEYITPEQYKIEEGLSGKSRRHPPA